MRVAHVNTAKDWRGGEQQLLLLMRGLAECPAAPAQVLYAPAGTPLFDRAQAAGFDVVPFRARSSGDLFATRRLRGLLKAAPPDVLHLHTAHAHSLGLRAVRFFGARRPQVVISRHVSYSIYRHFPWHLTWFKYTRGMARIVCVAEAVRKALRRNRIPANLLAVVPNGIDVAACAVTSAERAAARTQVRAHLGLEAEAMLVGAVGALTPEKGHAGLLEAFALQEPIPHKLHLVLVGAGPLGDTLRTRAEDLGIAAHVHQVGFQADIRPWLAALDLFVFPSLKEGLPMTVLQALAAGCPVLASAAGGIPEVLRDGVDGRLVPVGDGAQLSLALADLLDDAAERARLGAAAALRAREAHDYRRMAQETLGIYRSLGGATGPAS